MAKSENSGGGNAAGVGIYMAVAVGLGCLVGHWLDNKFGWGSKGLLVGAILGVVTGMYELIKEAMRMNKS